MLQGRGHTVLKSPMNFNDEIGLAMTLFQLDPTYDRAVVEVGMFELGEIRRLCRIAQPRIGVVLNVGPTHLGRLGSMQAIAEAKSEAVQDLPATGCAILNADDPRVAAMAAKTRARVLTFGTHSHADFRASEIQSHGLAGVEFTFGCLGRGLRVRSPLPGAALVPNALAALAVAVADGAGVEEAAEALTGAQVTPRLQAKRAACGATILDDTYNANPASMMAALDVLHEMTGHRYFLLDDMLDLGSSGDGQASAPSASTLPASSMRCSAVGLRGRADHPAAARAAGLTTALVRHFDTKEEAVEAVRAEPVPRRRAAAGQSLARLRPSTQP